MFTQISMQVSQSGLVPISSCEVNTAQVASPSHHKALTITLCFQKAFRLSMLASVNDDHAEVKLSCMWTMIGVCWSLRGFLVIPKRKIFYFS